MGFDTIEINVALISFIPTFPPNPISSGHQILIAPAVKSMYSTRQFQD